MAQAFTDFYHSYRRNVVEKLFIQLVKCDKLLVLIDISGLLAANINRCNDMETILHHLLSATIKDNDNAPMRLLTHVFNGLMPASMRMSKLKHIAFIANKADMVKYDQADKLQHLLHDLLKNKIRNYPNIQYDFFVCSALKSTEMNNNALLGYPVYDAQGQSTQPPLPTDNMIHLQPSDLPENWPNYWEMGTYYFPEVWPTVPYKKTVPPNQNGLEAILRFIFEEKR